MLKDRTRARISVYFAVELVDGHRKVIDSVQFNFGHTTMPKCLLKAQFLFSTKRCIVWTFGSLFWLPFAVPSKWNFNANSGLFFFFFFEINLHTSFLCQLKPSYCILFFNLIAMVRTLTVYVSIHPPPDSPQPHSLFLSCSLSTSLFLRHWFTSNSVVNPVEPISQVLWACFTVKNTFNVLFSNYSTQTQLITYLNSNKLVVF